MTKRDPNYVPLLRDSGKTKEQLLADLKEAHPEYFDEDGNQLPTAITGVRAPGGFYIPLPDRKSFDPTPKHKDFTVPPNFKPTFENPIPVVRCTSKVKRTGEQCGRWSIRGATVCIVHGGGSVKNAGAAERTIEAARMRMMGLAPDAVNVLEDLLTRKGVSDAVRLKTAQDLLDRIGLKATQNVEVEVTHRNPADEVMKRLDDLKKAAESRKGTAEIDYAVDAEIEVEDEDLQFDE